MIVRLIWPAVIALSALAAVAAVASGGGTTLQGLLVGWFLFVCPGLAFVGLLRLGNPYLVPGLVVAISLAIDLAVAEALLYAHIWSATTGVGVLAGISLIGASVQVLMALRSATRPDLSGG